jgi:7-cyano-7-deazaguanine synthase
MPTRMTSVCALASGGLDSAVLIARFLRQERRVLPLYVRCGFLWEDAELLWLRRFLSALRSRHLLPLHLVELPLRAIYGPHWSFTGRNVPGAASADSAVYLPGRNALLLAEAAVVAARRRISILALGTLKGNPFGDATPRFFATMASALTQALGRPIRVAAPLRSLRKPELIRRAAGAPLALTFSCLRPRGRLHCGRCNKCAERRRAFRLARVADPTTYVLA